MERERNELTEVLKGEIQKLYDRFGEDEVRQALEPQTQQESEKQGIDEEEFKKRFELARLISQKWLQGAVNMPRINLDGIPKEGHAAHMKSVIQKWQEERDKKIEDLCHELGEFLPKNTLEAQVLLGATVNSSSLVKIYSYNHHLRPEKQISVRRSSGDVEKNWTIHELKEDGNVEVRSTRGEEILQKIVPIQEIIELNPSPLEDEAKEV